MTAPADRRIAVIGVALRLPGADTEDEFWRLIRDGEDRIRHFTDEELAAAGVPSEKYRAPDFVGASAVLDGDVSRFDAPFFGMSAREATWTDPQHRLFLEVAYHALENAGYPQERPGTRIGVYGTTGYELYSLQTYLLNNVLPELTAEDWLSRMQVMVGNYPDFTATRASFRLDLTGPSVNIQTGCSSSLVAVQTAGQALLCGDTDIALVGAAAVHTPQVLGYQYVKGSILSRTGRLRAFDGSADGTVGGNGVAAIVLKRFDRAVADRDTVHGVISGWGVSNDGASKHSYTAPSTVGQQTAIRRALETAGVSADGIGLLETHGTGTLKGDPIEFDGATAAFRADTDRTGYCAIGSVKANIGHLDVASGLVGLIKAMLAVRHGVIPPLAGFERPNPALDLDASPFYIPRTARPWPRDGRPRRAGVTSLGVGGTNVHVLLEEPPPAPPPPERPAHPAPGVLLVSGRDPQALTANARALRNHLRRHPQSSLPDLVTTAALGRGHGRHRLAVRGDTPTALADALDGWLAGAAPAGGGRGRVLSGLAPREGTTPVAFLFAGQGSPSRGMAAPFDGRFRAVADVLDACEAQYRREYGAPLLEAFRTGPEAVGYETWPTGAAQPALFAFQAALTQLWHRAGVRPAIVAGHSAGEYAALAAAGALSTADGLRLTAERGRLMQSCPPGAMVAVAVGRTTAELLAAEVPGLELAVANGGRSHVLGGPVEAAEKLLTLLAERGIPGERLPVDRAFHTALAEPALGAFRTVLEGVAFRPLAVPFVSGLDGVVRPVGWVPGPDYFLRHTRQEVRFDAVLAALGAEAPDGPVLLDLGPHHTLGGLARRALPGATVVSATRRGAGTEPMWSAAAALHCAGVPVDWHHLLEGTGGGRTPLPGYRFQRRRYWTGPEPVISAVSAPREDEEPVEQSNAGTAVGDGVRRYIIDLTVSQLGAEPEEVADDTSFFDLGADSLQMIHVLRLVEQEYQVKVAMRELFEQAGTPRLLAELIVSRIPGAEPPAPPVPVTPPAPPAQPVPAPVQASVPAPAVPAPAAPAMPAPVYATRQEIDDLARQIQQLTQIQLQMMTQLSELVTRQLGSLTGGASNPAGGR
ncbi:beta-ketoacyl synthase N-terminal-like domain-containing protein [Kitasatospora sp. NPDC002227]|uniref:type I polyketide synthase n=1 Tax=Kitasatospora sp. NPDC002227 TaxID=3154773 RepID=UPI00332062F1